MNSQMYLKILLLIAGVHVSCTVLPKRQLYRIQNGPKVAGWPAVFGIGLLEFNFLSNLFIYSVGMS